MMKLKTRIFILLVFSWAAAPCVLWGTASGDQESSHYYLRGLLCERAGQLEQALENYERVLHLDPENSFIHKTVASLALRANQVDLALREAKKVAAVEPDKSESHLLLGRVYLAKGNQALSIKAFEQALALDPENHEALLYTAHLRLLTEPEKALAIYRTFLQKNPESIEVRVRISDLQRRLGDLAGAENTLKDILALYPSDFSAHLALAQIYEVRHDTAAALSSYETCRFLDPDNTTILLRLGELYYQSKKMALAQEVFAHASLVAPDDVSFDFWLALLAEEREDWNEAVLRMFKVSRESQKPNVMLRLSYYYNKQKKPHKSLETLQALQKQKPDNPDYMYYLALGYEDSEKYRQAIRWFKKIIKIDPARSEAYFHLGVNWDNLKKFHKAEPYLRRAVALNPGHGVAMNYLGYSWADRNKNLEQALVYIQQALLLDPDNPAYLDSLGWVYFRMGRLKEAEIALRSAVKEAEDPLVWEHYGEVLAKLGRPKDALKAWLEGFLLDPDSRSLKKKIKGKGLTGSVRPGTGAHIVLKKVEDNLLHLQNFAGFMRLGGKDKARPFQLKGLIYYARPQLFRLEFMGPFFAPDALLVKNKHGVHWRSNSRVSLDLDRTEYWLNIFGAFFSGEFVSRFDDAGVRVRMKDSRLTYQADFGLLEIDGRKKVLTRLEWKGRKGKSQKPVCFKFLHYRQTNGLWMPSTVECEVPADHFKISLDLKRIKVNAEIDGALFQTP